MKRLIYLTLAVLLFPFAAVCQNTIIKGTFNDSGKAVPKIYLFKIVNGENIEIANTEVIDGKFGFLFSAPVEGFYMVGQADMTKPQFPVYMKDGDVCTLKIDGFDVEFTGKQTPENAVLAKWVAMTQVVKRKSQYFMSGNSTYKDFFPDLNDLVSKKDAFKNSIKTSNKRFNELMKKFVDHNTAYYALNFIMTPRSAQPSPEDFPAYYGTVAVAPLSDGGILEMPYGQRYLGNYVMRGVMTGKASVDQRLDMVGTEMLKGEYVVKYMLPTAKSYSAYEQILETYGMNLVTDDQKKRAEEIGVKLYDTKPGGEAANFTYPDANGKMVSLSDFKGKVVLVDVWATWCGPCKAEIPAIKKLLGEITDSNFVFIGVSVDEDKDMEKWKEMVKEENLQGYQLFASGWSKITKDYKITGIPRFMLFDKKGNIVSTDAPRPSNPDLKKMILKELEK